MPIQVESAVIKTLNPIVCGCPKCKVKRSGSIVLQYWIAGVPHVLLDDTEYQCKCVSAQGFASFRFFESIQEAKTFADAMRRLISERGSVDFLKLIKAELIGEKHGLN